MLQWSCWCCLLLDIIYTELELTEGRNREEDEEKGRCILFLFLTSHNILCTFSYCQLNEKIDTTTLNLKTPNCVNKQRYFSFIVDSRLWEFFSKLNFVLNCLIYGRSSIYRAWYLLGIHKSSLIRNISIHASPLLQIV